MMRPPTIPVLTVGGSHRFGAGVGRSPRAVARDVVLPRCAHYPHEERPERVDELLARRARP